MSAALYLGLGAAVIAFACGVVLASSSRRYGAVLLLGVALAGAWFVALLLTWAFHRAWIDSDAASEVHA